MCVDVENARRVRSAGIHSIERADQHSTVRAIIESWQLRWHDAHTQEGYLVYHTFVHNIGPLQNAEY